MRLISVVLVVSTLFLATRDTVSATSDFSPPANVVGDENQFLRTHEVTEGQENKFAGEDSDDEGLDAEERAGPNWGIVDDLTKKYAQADDIAALKSVRAEQKSEIIQAMQRIKDQGNTPKSMKEKLEEGFGQLTKKQGAILLADFTKYFDRLN
ncbi:hypothetical protein PHYBOEH_005429 [Phytophthora boehmeriae]|uniref:RxLR effector protein n=1 Tax=Phytophthora boehmeriae TaxID=109152 RepID=A0A8T1WLR2_9STRA|nr:hypothetical protein PHYBOEH_005429 [Phytophthora boehmeriae]